MHVGQCHRPFCRGRQCRTCERCHQSWLCLWSIRKSRTASQLALLSAVSSEAWIQCHAAVDNQGRSDHVIGSIAGKPNDCARDVFGFSKTTVGYKGHEPLQCVLGLPRRPVDRRTNSTRRNRIDANALAGHLLRKAAHQHRNAALGRGVVRVSCPWNLLMYRTHTNDLARGVRYTWNDATATIRRLSNSSLVEDFLAAVRDQICGT